METSRAPEDRRKVWDMIKHIRVAMFVSSDEDGGMHARPMAAVQHEGFDGDLWFFTNLDSPKIDEIEGNPKVLLAYSEPQDGDYVAVTGSAAVVRDRQKIDELWTEALRVWFPKGANDPAIALIKVSVDGAEYWDAATSRMILAFESAKALLTGKRADLGENKRVGF